ncbi:MAG: outer membrane lipoprotein carrier protein LolA [Alphaproteobacteria bacterium]|nr:outer membrane lipoprotein carrier protein LolA [Alphaproteobacteria bacterium]
MRHLLSHFAILSLLTFLGCSAHAQGFNAQDKADIQRVERYFNGLTTVRSTFLQASSTGHVAQGMFWLSRPGRLRFEYEEPSPILITADGLWLTYQDNELQQTTQIPLFTSPLGVLVDDAVVLGEDLVVETITRQSNVLRLRLRQRDDPEQGVVTLVFQDRPLSLKQWVIEDAQGIEVKVALLNPVFGLELPASLWRPNDFERQADDVGR